MGARESYLDAHALAESAEHKAVVAHYFAGLLARNMMEPGLAIPYAKEAHEILRLPDTASSLGTALIWHNQYDEGIQTLEQAASVAEGRMKLIAKTALADAYMRRAAWTMRESRNPVQASYDAICAYELASDELDNGAADKRLRESACEAATAAIRYLMACQEFDHDVDTMPDFFDKLTKRLAQIAGADAWQNLRKAVGRYCSAGDEPYAISRLLKSIELVNSENSELSASVPKGSVEGTGDRKTGTIHSLRSGYGFIDSPSFAERVYFHKTGLISGVYFSNLRAGIAILFSIVPEPGGRLRADEIELG